MKKKLSLKETIFVASALFGMFFGAGNLIFPVHLGQLAGSNVLISIVGFCFTAVTIPVLGVVAIGNTNSSNIYELSSRVSKLFGLIFTCLLYLTIGPFFAVPRCATTSFSAGVAPILNTDNILIPQLIFTFIFFVIVLIFSLRPNEILKWVGKVINPLFLCIYLLLVVVALINPSAAISSIEPNEAYKNTAFLNSFLEGYGTMDGLASLCFGIVIVDIVKSLGIKDEKDVAKNIVRSGLFTSILLIIIYALSILVGAQSRGLFDISENGGIALSQIANHYLGVSGNIILAVVLLLACLKTAISIVASFSQMFCYLFPKHANYKIVTYIVCFISFAISNVGLTNIIEYSIPILRLLYPLSFVLISLGLTEKWFGKNRIVYVCSMVFTFIPAFFDFLKALPFGLNMEFVNDFIPFFEYGFGWFIPSILGVIVGVGVNQVKDNKENLE